MVMILFSAHFPSVQYLLVFLFFFLLSGGYFLLPLHANISYSFTIYIYIQYVYSLYLVHFFFFTSRTFSRRVATDQVSDETGQSVNSVIKPANPSHQSISHYANQSVIFFSRWTRQIYVAQDSTVSTRPKNDALFFASPPPPLYFTLHTNSWIQCGYHPPQLLPSVRSWKPARRYYQSRRKTPRYMLKR